MFMKKLLLVITILIGCMIYMSCSKDEDNNNKVITNFKEAIVGTWYVTYNTYRTNTDIITFNGKNMYFEAKCSLRTYSGSYSVIDNVITLSEATGKYPLDAIVITNMTESSFVGKADDYIGEIKGTRIK